MLNEIKYKIRDIPKFTRYYIITFIMMSIVFTFDSLFHLGIINYFFIDWSEIVYKFQVWRCFTNFVIVGKISLGLILHVLLVHFTFSRLEKEAVSKKQYDSFFIMIFFFFLFSLLFSYFFDLIYLSNEIQMAMLLVECKFHPDEIRSIWGFHVRSSYVPYVFLMMKASFGGDLISDLIGIIIGHLYYGLKYTIKEKYGLEVLITPRIM